MRIAYILYPDVIISNRSNGIRSQAVAWADMLQEGGHYVDLINNWGDYDWKEYDIIHLFGGGKWVYPIAKRLSKVNENIIWSPIIDPIPEKYEQLKFSIYRALQHYTNNRIQWEYSDAINSIQYCKGIFSRSMFEGEYLKRTFIIPDEKMYNVPLSYSSTCQPCKPIEKEPFCLHISSIYQERKNVLRLINAAKKYNFNLVLAGNKGPAKQFEPIKQAIDGNPNIRVMGFISEEEKIDLYKRAKVFALPSISEGVGIVALDAAYYECEIVITNIPGPKEYYKGKACVVNPYDIDAIGKSIVSCINGTVKYQPELGEYVKKMYSKSAVQNALVKTYKSLSNNIDI